MLQILFSSLSFASQLCKDAGYSAIASQIEVAGKLTILTISMPILMALLKTIHEFLAWIYRYVLEIV